MTVAVLDPALAAGDIEQVTGERRERVDPEVPERARRRTFTAQCKLDVVAEYDAAPAGEKGAVLRREGLYSSHVIEWRRARDSGAPAGPARPWGRPAADPRDAQIARQTKEKAWLEQELAKARFVRFPLHTDPYAPRHSSLSQAQNGGSALGMPSWS